jgi:MoxR-like ATPase
MDNVRNSARALVDGLGTVVAGQDDVKFKTVLTLLGNIHTLLEGVPGLAKTLLVETLPRLIEGSEFKRIQMTPDMKPGDITGFRVYNQATQQFYIEEGPVIGVNFLLADEINRTPGKTQSALLSAMQERFVTINGKRFHMEKMFHVFATQNPIEEEGTFPLPEAQLDRFGIKLILDYPEAEDEKQMLRNTALEDMSVLDTIKPVVSVAEILAMRQQIKTGVFVSEPLIDYIVELVRASRPTKAEFEALLAKQKAAGIAEDARLDSLLKLGGSPRAQQTLLKLGRVIAAIDGRDYVLPSDVRSVFPDIMRHRMILTREARFDGKTTDEAIDVILKSVPIVADEKAFKRS